MKNKKVLPVMLAALGALMIAATAAGSVGVPFFRTVMIIYDNTVRAALDKIGFPCRDMVFEQGHEQIIFYVRLPRVLLAGLTGSALSASGAVMQGMFRNPMADPGILGVSSGAGLGAVAAIASGLVAQSIYFLPLAASAGALAAAFLIFTLAARKGKIPVMNLLLSGIAVSMFLSAITTTVLKFVSGDQVKQFIFWTMGSLNRSRWESLQLVILPVLVCSVGISMMARELNVMLLGEEEAHSVGLNPARTRKLMLVLASINTAVCVSVTGTISFVGLIVPHIMRLIVGPDHRVLLPASIVGGAMFLILCDLAGRVILIPEEINAGIVTSIVGAPYFLFLLNRTKRGEGVF